MNLPALPLGAAVSEVVILCPGMTVFTSTLDVLKVPDEARHTGGFIAQVVEVKRDSITLRIMLSKP